MNLKTNYESLTRAKAELEELQENYDGVTNTKLSNIANRIELTLIDLRIEMEENKWKEVGKILN